MPEPVLRIYLTINEHSILTNLHLDNDVQIARSLNPLHEMDLQC